MQSIRIFILISTVCFGSSAASGSLGQTPAQASIDKAKALIAKQPRHAPYYNELAIAYMRRARETADVSFYSTAEEILGKSRQIDPDNYGAESAQLGLQVGRHDFRAAVATATRLNKRSPDDVIVYGYLSEAHSELGNYAAAVDAAQWMFKLRAGSVAALIRAAQLREVHGQLSGSLQLLQMAYDAMSFQETEERAWLLTQMAHVYLLSGDSKHAEQFVQGALEVFPDYHLALGTLSQVREAQKRFDEAVDLQRKRYASAPQPRNLFALADLLNKAGKIDMARQAFAQFEVASLKESQNPDNSNHELVAYYVDVLHQPEKAIVIAQLELKVRRDIYTLDGYAWALAAHGQLEEASAIMKEALATDTRDPEILLHAGVIEKKRLDAPKPAAR